MISKDNEIENLAAIIKEDRRPDAITKSYVFGGVACGVLVTGLVWNLSSYSLADALMAGTMTIILLVWMFGGELIECDDHRPISDESLKALADAISKIEIASPSSWATLNAELKAQGFLTIRQVDDFLYAEREARERADALNRPGASALLSRTPPQNPTPPLIGR